MSEDNINYEDVNLVNLGILENIRNQFWHEVFIKTSLSSILIEILDSQCPKCEKFIDSESKICKFCGVEFSSKNIKIFKKATIGGKGKKQCSGCNFYVAVRTYICDCGWDFRNKIQTTPKIVDEKLNNIKRKKAEYFKISEINDIDLLIKNDCINNNYLKVLKEIKDINGKLISLTNEHILKLGNELTHKRNQIINFNKKLVLNIVNTTYPSSGCKFLRKDDFISVGNYGLLKAVNHYDKNLKVTDEKGIEKSASFSTYATWWIKREIFSEILKKEKDIRIPNYLILIYKNFVNYYNKFKEDNGDSPILEDVMRDLNIKEKKARGLLFAKEYRSSIGMNIEDVNHYSDSEIDRKKGHANLKFNNGSLDTFRLTDSLNEETFEIGKIDWSKIKFKNDRYKNIFFNLKGLNGFPETCITDIVEKYDITLATVKKIEKETIEKIRKQLKVKIEE